MKQGTKTGEVPKGETPKEQKAPKGKKRLSRTAKTVWIIVGAVLVILLAAALYINSKLDLIRYSDGRLTIAGTIGAEEDQDLDGTGLAHSADDMEMPEGSPFADSDVINILLISTDERTDAVNDADAFTHLDELDGTTATTEFSEDARADSLILASLNIKDHTIKLASIERGTGVPINTEEYQGEYDWITHTFRYGGAKLTMDTVEDCFNVQVDHYVRINFNSFVQIVDAVGGVDLNLTDMEAKALNWEVPSNSMLIVNKVSPGWNHFDGYTALQYARLRKIDNDWQRIARQRTVIQAVLDQIKSANVMELDNLLNTVLPLVQTNFSKTEIAALLVQLPGFLGATAEQLSLPVEGSYGVRTGMDDRLMYDLDWSANIRTLQRFLYGSTSVTDLTGYFKDNSTALVDTDGAAVPLTDAAFGSAAYNVYLAGAGEKEDQVSDYTAQRTLFTYLHEKQGVNVLLADVSMGEGLVLNHYISTGDTSDLDAYLEGLAGTARCTNEEAAFWQWLRSYNGAAGGTLRVVGLAPETDASRAAAQRALRLLLDKNSTVRGDYGVLVKMMEQENPYAAQTARKALDESYYKARKLFGDDWATATQLLRNLLRQAQGEEQSAAAVMLENFNFAQKQYPEEKFFGQLPAAQVLQSDAALEGEAVGTDRFAMLLKAQMAADAGDAGTAAEEICSILYLYPDVEPQPAGLAQEGPVQQFLSKALRTNTLIALDGAASPYAIDNGFFAEGAEAAGAPATAYFQKLITLTGDEKCTPYGEIETPETAGDAQE